MTKPLTKPLTIEQYHENQIKKIKKIAENYDKQVEEIKKIAEGNKEALLAYIKRELDSGRIPVRIGVYSSGNFKGYKVDSFWALHPAFPKIHSLEDIQPSGKLLNNFLYFLNKHQKSKKEDLEVVVEELNSEGEPVRVALKYHVSCKYTAELVN